jgi:RHS repeat-associated protein
VQDLYDYDAAGMRVRHRHQIYQSSQWVTIKETLFVYDAFGRLAAEYGDPSAEANCVTCYVTTDMLGSTRLVTDQLGNAVARYDYLPFGQTLTAPSSGGRGDVLCGGVTCYPQEGATTQAIGQQFTGMMHDFDTGMDYFYARYYSSAQGRFTSSDIPFIDQYPGNPQSWNLYGYVRNNPLRYVDLDGRGCGPDGRDTETGADCRDPGLQGSGDWACRWFGLGCGSGGGRSGDPIGNPPGQEQDPDTPQPPANCVTGGFLGLSMGADAQLGLPDLAGAIATGSAGGAAFYSKDAGVSGGGFASGGAAAYAGRRIAGVPAQEGDRLSALGAYVGIGPNITFGNAGSVQQLAGPFTTVSANVGLGLASLGVQVSYGGGIWQASITPPIPWVSAGVGFALTALTTNTVATNTGCKP